MPFKMTIDLPMELRKKTQASVTNVKVSRTLSSLKKAFAGISMFDRFNHLSLNAAEI